MQSPEPFLILHKVRGLPAFDIAIQLDVGTDTDPGPWWIIPTSGHRAYPVEAWTLHDVLQGDYGMLGIGGIIEATQIRHAEARDHYEVSREEAKTFGVSGAALLTKLGLVEKIKRRV